MDRDPARGQPVLRGHGGAARRELFEYHGESADFPLSGFGHKPLQKPGPPIKRYRNAGLTMPLRWPPFRDVPTSKTLDDLERLVEEIMPKGDAA